MRWSTADIADVVAQGLEHRARLDDLEQAVYGFDHLDELGLHPLIHAALRTGGYGVWPEQRYPGDREKKKRSEGQRCDVVLTPFTDAGRPALRLREEAAKGTLFDDGEAVDPRDAYWLEIKTVAQFETTGPFGGYSGELLSAVAQDVMKLWRDPHLRHAGLLLTLFTADSSIAEHDAVAWHARCLERGYPVGVPASRGFAITDRIGNAWCAVYVFPVRGE